MLTKSIGVYAAISSAIIVGLSALVWIIAGSENYPFAAMGWGSYLILLLGHLMVFGLVPAQKKELGTYFNFREALKAALITVSLSSLAYAFYMAIFMNFMHEPFLAYFVGVQKANLSSEDFKLFIEVLKEQAELYRSPLYHAGLAFITSFALGFLLSLPVAWRFSR
jgi:hypothetical protein